MATLIGDVFTDSSRFHTQSPQYARYRERHGGASRFPSPPSSTSSEAQHGAVMEPSPSASSTATTVAPAQIPSPASDRGPRWNDDPQREIHVRDLAHVESLSGPASSASDPPLQAMKYDISGMPINDVIEMVAALLTKITTTNDLQHDALNRNAAHIRQAQAAKGDEEMSPLSSSVLAFHGKNVPAITILSYLSRIHKYCPTTYEVFLSLLVYFDRMTERVNDQVLKAEEARRQEDAAMSDETDSDLADDDDDDEPKQERGQATYFVVDSFNIHRLIIAGVTCASKFFSDVFYTNSRYAKVCARARAVHVDPC